MTAEATHLPPSRAGRIGALAALAARRPRATLLLAGVLAVISVAYAARHLPFVTQRNALVGENLDYNQRYLAFEEEMGDPDGAVVVVPVRDPPVRGGLLPARGELPPARGELVEPRASLDPEDRRARAEALVRDLAAALRREPDLFPRVIGLVEPRDLGARSILYLPTGRVEEVARAIRQDPDLAARAAEAGHLADLVSLLSDAIDRAVERASAGAPAEASRAGPLIGPALAPFLDAIDRAARGRGPAPEGLLRPHFLETADGSALLLIAVPALQRGTGGLDARGSAVERLRELVAAASERWGCPAGLTGQPVLAVEEMAATTRDMTLATILSIVLVFGLFVVWFRRIGMPILAMISLLAATAWTFGFAAVAVGRLNLLSVVFCSTLIGLGIDFGIHILTYSERKRAEGAPVDAAIVQACREAGPGVFAGGVTTAMAFFTMQLTDFQGLRELGVISGGGILLCLLASFTVLPALVVLFSRGARPSQKAVAPGPLLHGAEALTRRPGTTVVGALLVVGAGLALGGARTGYRSNLLELLPEGLESVRLQRELLLAEGPTAMAAAVVCDDPASLAALRARVEALPEVGRTMSILDAYPEEEEAKLALLAGIRAALAEIPDGPADPGEPVPGALAASLDRLAERLDAVADEAFESGEREAVATLVDLSLRTRRAAEAVRTAEAAGGEALAPLAAYESVVTRDVRDALRMVRDAGALAPARGPEDLPAAVRDHFVGRTGKLVLLCFPSEPIWDGEPLRRFCEALRGAAPEATGIAFQIWESSRRMLRAYEEAGVYAFLLIAFYLAFHFRSPRGLLALVPLALAAGLWLGVMALLGTSLNPANIVVLPLIVGTGVDYGVYILHAWIERPGPVVASETGRAVGLSSLTTVAGFGSLAVAHHRGIWSIGVTVGLAVGTTALVALYVLPSILALLRVRRAAHPAPPAS